MFKKVNPTEELNNAIKNDPELEQYVKETNDKYAKVPFLFDTCDLNVQL